MSFDLHSDVSDLPVFQGTLGLSALGYWVRRASWTSANGKTGIVPRVEAIDLAEGDADELIPTLVAGGIREEVGEGIRMLRGPSSEMQGRIPSRVRAGPVQPIRGQRRAGGETEPGDLTGSVAGRRAQSAFRPRRGVPSVQC